MYNRVLKYVQKNRMLEKCSHVVAGLSGGADSVCLLDILDRMRDTYGYTITAVHVHHGIRGAEADRDRDMCRQLCSSRNIELKEYYYNVPEYASQHNLTCEEAGRQLRYEAFSREAKTRGSVIAVAHHMNDQAETVIFNMCRGSSIRGMRGMQPVNGIIIRPLLCCLREEIEAYDKRHDIEYVNDSTNAESDYSRNRIRNELIPYITENINSNAVGNIAAMALRAGEAESYLDRITRQAYNSCVKQEKDGILLYGLENLDRYIAGRVVYMAIGSAAGGLKDISNAHVDEVMELLDNQSGRSAVIRKNITARKNSDGIYISTGIGTQHEPVDVTVPSTVELWNSGKSFTFSVEEWTFDKKITNEVYTKCFDYDKIKIGLQLRNRKAGDYVAIDSAGHHKKLKQYFIDEKIPQRRRDECILLAEGSHILWIVGERISAEYKVTDSTVRILKVQYGGQTNGES